MGRMAGSADRIATRKREGDGEHRCDFQVETAVDRLAAVARVGGEGDQDEHAEPDAGGQRQTADEVGDDQRGRRGPAVAQRPRRGRRSGNSAVASVAPRRGGPGRRGATGDEAEFHYRTHREPELYAF